MASRIISDQALTDAEARSVASARTRTIRSLAGRPRHLYELATGASAVSGEPPLSPRNPQGLFGVDLSGPPWGSALLHPIAWFSGLKDDPSPAPGVQAPDGPLDSIVAQGVAGKSIGVLGPWRIWQRPFDLLATPGKAPYSRGRVVLRAHGSVATSTDVTVTTWNSAMGPAPQTRMTTTFTQASTSESNHDLGTDFWVPLQPGENEIVLIFTHAESTNAITVDSLVIYNTVKRSH